MRRFSLFLACLAAGITLVPSGSSYGQFEPLGVSTVGVAPQLAVSSTRGAQVSDGVMLHTGVSGEAGYDSNVFYQESSRAAAAQVRVTPFLELTNAPRTGEIPSGLFFSARAALTYRKYISDDEDIRRVPGFMPTVSGVLEHNAGTLAFGVTNTFARLEDAPYFRGAMAEPIRRNSNVAAAQLRWSPGGGRLQTLLRYTLTVDWFETDLLKVANSTGHEAMLDVAWRWLPKTAVFLQARQGYISYWGPEAGSPGVIGSKVPSYPLRVLLGLRGLVTQKTSVTVGVGYQKGFYVGQIDTSGFLGSTLASAELVVLPIASTRLTLGLRHEFQNSVIGRFYYNDGAYASLAQQLAGRLVAQLWARYDYRQYYGIPGAVEQRKDHVTTAGAMVDLFVRSWAFIGASYALSVNRSDYSTDPAAVGLNYTKHVVMARLGVTY